MGMMALLISVLLKASLLRYVNLLPPSKYINKSPTFAKASSPIVWTEAGIMMEVRPLQFLKARDPIVVSVLFLEMAHFILLLLMMSYVIEQIFFLKKVLKI